MKKINMMMTIILGTMLMTTNSITMGGSVCLMNNTDQTVYLHSTNSKKQIEKNINACIDNWPGDFIQIETLQLGYLLGGEVGCYYYPDQDPFLKCTLDGNIYYKNSAFKQHVYNEGVIVFTIIYYPMFNGDRIQIQMFKGSHS